jgi:prepilin-type N-terminal cleavage/methylation domain-containing protein
MTVGAVRRRGFTVLELLVVMGIIALLAAIVLAFFGQASRSQRRYRAITNMRIVYSTLRQYQLEEGGLPPFSPALARDIYLYKVAKQSDPSLTPETFPLLSAPRPDRYWYGLWALVTTGALASRGPLHDPSTRYMWVDNGGTTEQVSSTSGSGRIEDDFFWCTLQTFDPDKGLWSYLPSRDWTANPNPAEAALNYRRQLWPDTDGDPLMPGIPPFTPADGSGQVRWMPAESTVVCWNPYYRTGQDPVTLVLYWDGTVQLKRTFVADPDPGFIDPLAE